jgi:hypothetical protein
MIIVCVSGSLLVTSCLKNNEPSIYTEAYSVIRSAAGISYFSSDDGFDLYLENGTFNPQWGNDGDRVLVGFFYNPTTIRETTTKINIKLENLISIRTVRSALPSTVDTVGSGAFLYDNDSDQSGIVAWAAQNYLTAIFFVKYSDASKHTFGFIEEPAPFRNDTLFLTMWHNTKETSKSQTSKSHIALDLSSYYDNYLSVRDSTVISIKYNGEHQYSSDIEKYTYNVMYRKKYNTQ